jgi:hypothetical protein
MKILLKDYFLASLLFKNSKKIFSLKRFKKNYRDERFLYLSFANYFSTIKSPFQFYISKNIKLFESLFFETYYKDLPILISLVPKKDRFKDIEKSVSIYRKFYKKQIEKKINTIFLIQEDLKKIDINILIEKKKLYSIFDILKLVLLNEDNVISSKIDEFLLTKKSTYLYRNILEWFLNLNLDSLKYFFVSLEELIDQFQKNFELFIHIINLNDEDIKKLKDNLIFDGFLLTKFDYYELIKETNKFKYLNKFNLKGRIKIRYGSYFIDDTISLSDNPGYILV